MFSTNRDLVRQAVALLPPMPSSIEVFSADGGAFSLTLAEQDGDLVYAYGPRALVREGLELEHQVRNDEGDGHDIDFVIVRTFFQSGEDLLLHLNVTGIEDHYASRSAPRAALSAPATLRVVHSANVDRDTVAEIRVADASRNGIAFLTDRLFRPGDVLEIHAPLPDRMVKLGARVLTTIPSIYGRNRVGCEITTILEADRHELGLLATLARQQGTEDDRRPDLRETLQRARQRQTLAARRTPRYQA